MFKKLIENVKKTMGEQEPVDPAVFRDPLAMRTEWRPAKRGGSNFCTHKLHRINPARLEFKMTPAAFIFGLLFAVLGCGLAVAGVYFLVTQNDSVDPMARGIMTFMGLIFGGAGIGILRVMSVPAVIDTKLGLFWRGRQDPRMVASRGRLKECLNLSEVHAIQLIKEYCRNSSRHSNSRSAPYYSYELNFVLRDGSRITVVDHGSQKIIREDAELLANAMNVPLWDAT